MFLYVCVFLMKQYETKNIRHQKLVTLKTKYKGNWWSFYIELQCESKLPPHKCKIIIKSFCATIMCIYIYIYMDVCVFLWIDIWIKRIFYLQHLWTASNCLRKISLCGLLVCGLGVKIDKEMCPRESTEF